MDQRTIEFLKSELEIHEHDLQYVKHPQTQKEIKQKIKLIKEALRVFGYIFPKK